MLFNWYKNLPTYSVLQSIDHEEQAVNSSLNIPRFDVTPSITLNTTDLKARLHGLLAANRASSPDSETLTFTVNSLKSSLPVEIGRRFGSGLVPV